MYIKPSEAYRLSWPISCGQLNVCPNISGMSVTALIQDIQDIWGYAIQEYLDIPIKDLKVELAIR